MRKTLIILATFGIVGSYFLIAIYLNLQTQRNDVSISLIDHDVRSTSLTIGVIGDVHLSEGLDQLNKFRALLLDVKAAKPDLVVFVGDYTANPSGIDNMPDHRVNIINALKLVNPIPRAVVLGNYVRNTLPKMAKEKGASQTAQFRSSGGEISAFPLAEAMQ